MRLSILFAVTLMAGGALAQTPSPTPSPNDLHARAEAREADCKAKLDASPSPIMIDRVRALRACKYVATGK